MLYACDACAPPQPKPESQLDWLYSCRPGDFLVGFELRVVTLTHPSAVVTTLIENLTVQAYSSSQNSEHYQSYYTGKKN